MMGNLDQEKVKLIFSYSIAGLIENKDYNISISVKNRKIFFEIFYFKDNPQTLFTVNNKVSFVSVKGELITNSTKTLT
jgi:hypothetical protein